jgi:hypothetical protein
MFTHNPFAGLGDFLPVLFMPIYVVLMLVAVVVGTLADVHHKGSGLFFARRREESRKRAQRRLSGGENFSLALETIAEAAVSGEFCKWPRRASHLLMMYGFLLYIVTTVVMVFNTTSAPSIVPALWTLGGMMILAGGLWFFFFLRVNVAYDGASPFSLGRADLFVGSLIASVAFALIWQATSNRVLFWIFLFFTTLLFVSVPWSKFGHMFFKPAVAFQRRVEEAEGSSDLPSPAAKSHIVTAEVQVRS